MEWWTKAEGYIPWLFQLPPPKSLCDIEKITDIAVWWLMSCSTVDRDSELGIRFFVHVSEKPSAITWQNSKPFCSRFANTGTVEFRVLQNLSQIVTSTATFGNYEAVAESRQLGPR